MGRIIVTKAITKLCTDQSYRAELIELLDYEICPRGLSSNQLRAFLKSAVEAQRTQDAFARFMQRLYAAIWDEPVVRHIRATLTPSDYPFLDRHCCNAVGLDLIQTTWESRQYERQVGLPRMSLRKSTHPILRTSIIIDVDGYVVLAFDIERPLRIKRLRPAGTTCSQWRWSHESGYEYPSKIQLLKTRCLDISELKQAAESAMQAVAEFYVPEHLRREAAAART